MVAALFSVSVIGAMAAVLGVACSPVPLNSALSFDGNTVAPPPPPPPPDNPPGTGGTTPIMNGAGGAVVMGTPDAAPDVGVVDVAVDVVPADLSLPRDGGGCQLNTVVTTQTRDTGFSPSNVGAIWIADAADKYIKSLNVWAAGERSRLVRWNAVTLAAGVRQDRTDAVTSASKNSDGTRTAAWNCTDYKRMPVPDGGYKVCYELNETNGSSLYDCVPFTKSPQPLELRPLDTMSFKKRVIDFSP